MNKIQKIGIGCVALLAIASLGGVVIVNYQPKQLEDNEIKNQEFVDGSEALDDGTIMYEVTSSYSYRTSNPEDLYEMANLVVIANFVEDVETQINENEVPFTISKFNVQSIIKNTGNFTIGEDILTKRNGGTVSLQQLLNARDDAFAEKIGANDLTTNQKSSAKVRFKNESIGDLSLEEENTRLLFLHKDEDEEYFTIIANDYGMLSYDNATKKAYNVKESNYTSYSFLKQQMTFRIGEGIHFLF